MCVSVWVTPATLLTPPGMTSASCSWVRTRTIATMSNSPVTEYTSLTSGILAIVSATSGMRWISAFTRTIAVTTGASEVWIASLPGLALTLLRQDVGPGAELGQRPDAAVRQAPDQPAEHVGGGARVGQRAVARRGPGAEEPGQRAQLAVRDLVRIHHLPGQHDGVQHGEPGPGQPAVVARRAQEAEVERRIVRDQDAPAREGQQAGQDRGHPRCRGQHPVGDSGQVLDARRDRRAGVDQRGELSLAPAAADPDRADLGDRSRLRRPARRLQVDDGELDLGQLT